jgi:hypothetical protein
MSEPTYFGEASEHGAWSRVHTGLDWVARWMADRGYTDAEIAYVVGDPRVPAVPVEALAAVDPVEAHVDESADEPVEAHVDESADETIDATDVVFAEQPVWTVPLGVVEAGAEHDETDQPEATDYQEPATA